MCLPSCLKHLAKHLAILPFFSIFFSPKVYFSLSSFSSSSFSSSSISLSDFSLSRCLRLIKAKIVSKNCLHFDSKSGWTLFTSHIAVAANCRESFRTLEKVRRAGLFGCKATLLGGESKWSSSRIDLIPLIGSIRSSNRLNCRCYHSNVSTERINIGIRIYGSRRHPHSPGWPSDAEDGQRDFSRNDNRPSEEKLKFNSITTVNRNAIHFPLPPLYNRRSHFMESHWESHRESS